MIYELLLYVDREIKFNNMPYVVYSCPDDLTNSFRSLTVVMPMLNYHLDCPCSSENIDRKIDHYNMQLPYLLLPPTLNSTYLLHLLMRLQYCRQCYCCCYSTRLDCLLAILVCLVDSNRFVDSLNGIY